MAVALHVDKVERNGVVLVRHTFFGETLRECEELRDQHAAGCKAFGPALEDGRVVEESETISDNEWPEYDDDGTAVIDV